MRRLAPVILVLTLFAGCSFIQARKLDFEACKASVECMADANKWKATGELVGGLAGSIAPGAAMPAQKVAGYAALFIAMLVGGHALNKKKENP